MTASGAIDQVEISSAHAADERCDDFALRLARARVPSTSSIETFDFSKQPMLSRETLTPQLSPSFVESGASVILTGKAGRGKTHLACAIAQRAVMNGYDALFVSASRLIEAASREIARGRGRAYLLRYLRTPLLVLDDVGYALHHPNAASILYQIVSERHQLARSMIVTASKPPERWAELLGSDDAADAILDRLLENGVHVELGGPSMRRPHFGEAQPSAAGSHMVLRLPVQPVAEASEDGEALCKRVARQLVGALGLKEAIYHLRGAMNEEALDRSRGSRRAAASLLGVDRRYVQRLAEEYSQGSAEVEELP